MTLVRYAVLAVPLLALGLACVLQRPSRQQKGALLLAFLAALVGIAVLDRLARALGWWQFAPVDGAFGGFPVDAWLGWSMLWGPLPVAVGWLLPRWRVVLPLGLVAWTDLLAMPLLGPLLQVRPGWWCGELAGVLLVAAPAVLLGHWTADRRRLHLRVAGQLALFAGLVLWLLPTIAMSAGSGSWRTILAAPRWELSLLVQALLLAAAPGLAAVAEFAGRGGGTPYPWDPPSRLVTTGPYAYLANPMQVSAVGLLIVLAVGLRSWSVLVAAVLAGVFSEAVAEKHEREDLRRRLGEEWLVYQRRVRRWIPRVRPVVSAPATLYVDLGCDPCQELNTALQKLRPTGLQLADARDHAEELTRVRYEHSDGLHADGLAAVARAAEHIDLGYALLGWIVRLPVLSWLLARCYDAAGFGPGYGQGRDSRKRRTHGGRHSTATDRRRDRDRPA